MDFNEIVESVKRFCLSDPGVSEIGFNKWLKPLEAVRLEGKTCYLAADNEFTRRTVSEVYEAVLKRGFQQALGFEAEVVITLRADRSEDDAIQEIINQEKNVNQILKGARYDLTFDNFIKGKSNELAYAFCIAVSGKNENAAMNAKEVFNPLFIYGESGLGKTHLLKAIEHEITARHPELKVIYTTGESFTNELVKAIMNKQTYAFHEKYRSADFFLVDDVQFIAGRDSSEEEFFHTFNELYNRGKQIVLTSDIPPSKITKLQNRIRTRFALGVQVDVQAPDFETRMAIVKRKAELLNLSLSDVVARIVSEKIKTNIRQLEGAVNKMKALTIYTNEVPSVSMAQRVIKEVLIDNQPSEITVDRIISDVATAFSVSPDEIRSANRNAPVSLARKIAIYVFREVKSMTYIEIGKELGRNHSTMTTSYQDVSTMLKKNSDLRETVEDIIKNLKEN
ncbi:MAG: chromosomal replication initiator protein DnaA [Oscillospiraceae bacterium]